MHLHLYDSGKIISNTMVAMVEVKAPSLVKPSPVKGQKPFLELKMFFFIMVCWYLFSIINKDDS